jgi:hypothetical protein
LKKSSGSSYWTCAKPSKTCWPAQAYFTHRSDGHTLVICDDTTTQARPIEPIAQVRFQGGNVKERVDSKT